MKQATDRFSDSALILTDGKAGDEQQCLAIAEALGLRPDIRHVQPRPPFSWLMPRGPIDPAEGAERPGSPIGPPWPDLAIASGRRVVPYVRALKRASEGRVFTVILKDPRTGPDAADLIWTPVYDRVRGSNVVATLTSPHRLSIDRLAAARTVPDPRLARLPAPRAAVLVGGSSRHLRFTAADTRRFVDHLTSLARAGVSLMVSTSRRTPPPLGAALRDLVALTRGFLWDGEGENPHLAAMALADLVVVTADSVNMISEAVATGAPVLVFELPRGAARHRVFLDALIQHGAVRPFVGQCERFAYEPLDSTPLIAQAVAQGLARHRARRDLP